MKINNSIVLKVLIVGILIGALMTNLIYAFLPIEFVDYSNMSYLRRYLGKISDVEDDVVVEAITTTSTSLTTSSSTSSTTIPTSTTTTSSTSSSTTSTTTTSTSSSTTTTSSTSSTTVSTTSTTLGGKNFVDSFGSVVINEVMYDPTDEFGGSINEWVELYNPTNGNVNTSEWTITDEVSGHDSIIPNGRVLNSGDYFLIAVNKTLLLEYYQNLNESKIIQGYSNYWLNQGGDTIYLNDGKNNIIDTLVYVDEWGGDGSNMTLEKINPLGNNSESNWNGSLVAGGTPGSKNSVS